MEEIKKFPLETYQEYLLTHLIKIYTARKAVTRNDWTRHSDLLIDKFAIHSGTLFHLINGIIELKNSEPNTKKVGFDLFSVNSIIRVLIETYITFNHIFVFPKSEGEKEFRFLLWQLDGLLEQKKFNIQITDFEGAEDTLIKNQERIDNLFDQIKKSNFYSLIPLSESKKIFDSTNKSKAGWKFLVDGNFNIKPLKIIGLVESICVSRSFINLYKYTSTHTHSGYLSIQHFENNRGKEISKGYTDPLIHHALFLTMFLIKDITLIDQNASKVFDTFPERVKVNINGINKAYRKV